ncbi:MAG TPA: hypothetical protein VKQ72_21370 [Aggregatilineales bacterium]|nr:hypothetical protein [Aggregatilineales bacterium]
MSFLTPRVFDVLVIVCIIVGLVLAAARIRADFRRGPRWPDEPVQPPTQPNDADGREMKPPAVL